MADLKKLITASDFTLVDMAGHEGEHQLVLAVNGQEGSGKTFFSLSAPGPIAYFNIDKGLQRVVKSLPHNGKQIIKCEISIPERLGNKPEEKLKIEARQQLDKFYKNYKAALTDSSVRSIVIDNSSTLWDLILLTHFGKTTQIKQQMRTAPNLEMQQIVRAPIDDPNCTKVVVHIQQVKKEYKGDDWDGKSWEAAGYNKMSYLVDACIMLAKSDKKRIITATVTKPGMQLAKQGAVWVLGSYDGDDSVLDTFGFPPFAFVASELTDTDPDDWEDKR